MLKSERKKPLTGNFNGTTCLFTRSGGELLQRAREMKKFVGTFLTLMIFASGSQGQSGGTFTITKSVIAGGGGSASGGTFALDGTIGQNAVQQAKIFSGAVPVSGLVVTKLDGTARGGIVVAVHEAIDVPVKFLGTGEQAGDLEPFDAAVFARELLAE